MTGVASPPRAYRGGGARGISFPMHAFTEVGRVLLTLAVALGVLAGPIACAPAESKQGSVRTGRGTKSQIPDPGPDAPGRPTAPLRSATDPCADRLHAICG